MIKKNKQTKASPSGCCGVSQSVTQSTLLFKQLCLQMFVAMSHWSGLRLWLLIHSQCWSHMGAPLRYPVAALGQGDPAALALPSCSYHGCSCVLTSSMPGLQLCLHRAARAASSPLCRVVISRSLEWLRGQFHFPWLLVLPRKKGLTSHGQVSALGSGKSLRLCTLVFVF